MMKSKLVVFTGAGISAESGIQTFRGLDGLWEGNRIEDVASPEGFLRNPVRVLHFYNSRRKACRMAQPNAAHIALVALEEYYDVVVITQNIDDLHERAGSTHVLHLHGEIFKVQSSVYPEQIYDLKTNDLNIGDLCPMGTQLRPHVVWFGETVGNMSLATKHCREAAILLVIGTSLQLYPAANLVHELKDTAKAYVIDPEAATLHLPKYIEVINEKATVGVPELVKKLTE